MPTTAGPSPEGAARGVRAGQGTPAPELCFSRAATQGDCALAESPRDTYITGLVNAHALENQAVSILSRQVERLENYPEMSDQLRLHIDESKAQAQRLEEILSSLGTSHSTLKDMVTSFAGNMAALAHAPMQDEVIKNTFANFAFEHFEIAAYRSLLTMAELAGDNGSPKLLQQSLDEEIRMAKWIEDNLDATTRKYVQLSAAGQKAGV